MELAPKQTAKRFDPCTIRTARKLVGLTTKEFGAAIGRSHQTVVNWEKGITSPTVRDLEVLCEKFGFDLFYFLKKVV